MVTLPPPEIAQIDTSRLREPEQARRWSWPRFSPSRQQVIPVLLFLAFAAPVGFVWASQPRSPGLASGQQQLISAYLEESVRPPQVLADAQSAPAATNTLPSAELTGAPSTPTPTPIDLTANQQPGTYGYQLSLSQGFLTKAISRSQTTSQGQSESDRQAILADLQQALDAANKAIELDPTQGLGFLMRARVYKTAGSVKPELLALADQDLSIARALGVNGDQLNDPNPLQHIPTVVAEPEEGNQTSVSAETTANVLSGRVVLPTGNRTIDVSLPELSPRMSLRVDVVDPTQNATHAIFTVVSRQEGQGFTIQSTLPAAQNIELEWRAITE